MPNLPLSQLEKQLQMPSSLYVVYGEEELLLVEAVDTIRKVARQQQYDEREKYVIEHASDWQVIIDAASSSSLFANRKSLEIHLPTGKPGTEGAVVLQELAAHPPEDTLTLIILHHLERAQQQSKWFTALVKNAQMVEAKSVGREELPAWIGERLKRFDLHIEPLALTIFAERVEGNLLAAKQEIDKLSLLFPAGSVLTEDDIQYAIANVAKFDPFQLSEAWLSGDTSRLLRLLDSLEQEGDAPVLLLWSLSEDIRILLRLKAFLSQGETVGTVSRELRLWGKKQKLAPLALKRIGVRRLLSALQECARIDRQIKGVEEGNAWDSLKILLLNLMSE